MDEDRVDAVGGGAEVGKLLGQSGLVAFNLSLDFYGVVSESCYGGRRDLPSSWGANLLEASSRQIGSEGSTSISSTSSCKVWRKLEVEINTFVTVSLGIYTTN